MIHKFLKIGGVSSVDDFYKKYATEEDFFNAHPESQHLMAEGGQTDDYGIPTEEADRLRATSQINFTQPAYFKTGGPLSDDRYMYNQGGINEYNWGGSSNGPLGYFEDGGEQGTASDTYKNDPILQKYIRSFEDNNAYYDSINNSLLNQEQDNINEEYSSLRYGGLPKHQTTGQTGREKYEVKDPAIVKHWNLKNEFNEAYEKELDSGQVHTNSRNKNFRVKNLKNNADAMRAADKVGYSWRGMKPVASNYVVSTNRLTGNNAGWPYGAKQYWFQKPIVHNVFDGETNQEQNNTDNSTETQKTTTASPYRITEGGGQKYYWKGNVNIREDEYPKKEMGGIQNSNMKPQFATGGITNYGAFSPVMEYGGLKPNKGLIHKMAKAQFGLNTQSQSAVPTITSVTEGKKDFITKYLSENIAKVEANNLYKEHQDMINQGMNPNMDPNMGQNMDQGMEQMPQDMQQAYAEFGGSMYENLGQNQYAYGGGLHRFLPRHQDGIANTGQYEDEGSPENEAFWNTQVGNFNYPQVNPSYSVNPNSIGQQPLSNALETPPYENKPNQMIQNPFGDPNERADVSTTQTNTPQPFTLNKPYNPYANALKPFDVTKGTDPFASKQRTEDVTQPFDKDADRGHRFRKAMDLEENFQDEAKKVKKPNWFKSHAGDIGRGIVATMNKINAQLENREAKKSEKEDISRGKYSGDRNFIEVPKTSSSKGNYAINGMAEGMLRPDQYVPVQYRGYNAGNIDQYNGSYYSSNAKYGGTSHKKDTEIYMTEDELEKFLKAGGQVEYLD
jgi:hypothetical protein